ncbi:unnamed protein product [Phaedon cochleariae]|uniref:acid phosphatase n=1 Tax=Phaedon cochleariae TaxID=80249 RepID=A0A9N9X406_PHACE|nr:unnamed protein product [Phaedon cochleariae]
MYSAAEPKSRREDNLEISNRVLYRHGARTPITLYKNDPYASEIHKIWPEGLGQLNDEGIQQQYLLGKWLRQRYENFIRPQYHLQDLLVHSSDVDRCLMSASANLAGFAESAVSGLLAGDYTALMSSKSSKPVCGCLAWPGSIEINRHSGKNHSVFVYTSLYDRSCQIGATWRPAPIHTAPSSTDAVLALSKPCARYDRLYAELLKTDLFVDFFEMNRELFDYLSEHAGEEVRDFTRLTQLNDALNVQRFYNLTLPAWTEEVHPEMMAKVVAFHWIATTFTKELARLRIGPLIDKITNHFEAISNRIPGTSKFLMLSGHDTTLAFLLNSLGIYDMVSPKYAATVIFELRQSNDFQYINIFYKNSTRSDEAHAKTLYGSDFDCPLEEFRRIVAPIRINQESWDKECIGKQQHYALGKWLRARYEGFLPTAYYYEDITVHSSNVDRCLMSATANLAGLYPPEETQVWNPSLLWQPIPVHTKPQSDDAVLAAHKSCRKYDMTYDGTMFSEHFQEIFKKNSELFEYLSVNSGNNISDFNSYTNLWNTLYIEALYNLTLPEWTKDVFPDKMRALAYESWRSFTYTTEMALFKSGPLIDQITTHFEYIVANTTSSPKLLMLSAHDSTIAFLLNSLNLFEDHWPEYASAVILELRKAEGHQYVNILYKNETYSDEVVKMTLDGCHFDCELDQFREIVRPIRINLIDWEVACSVIP